MFAIGFLVWNERLGDANEENSWSRGKTGTSVDRTACSNDGLDSTFDRIQNVQSSMAFVGRLFVSCLQSTLHCFRKYLFSPRFRCCDFVRTMRHTVLCFARRNLLTMPWECFERRRATDLYYFSAFYFEDYTGRETRQVYFCPLGFWYHKGTMLYYYVVENGK